MGFLEVDSPKERAMAYANDAQSAYGQDMQAEPQKPGMGEQFAGMAKQKAMQGALTAGQTGLTSAMSGTGAMAGVGTAMPYVGAGILAGKALGLFNQGGQVGPLNAQYHAEGTGAMKTPGMEALLEELAYKDYVEAYADRLGAYQTGTLDSGNYSAGGPISAQYHAEGTGAMKTPEMEKLLEGLSFEELYKQEYGDASIENWMKQHSYKSQGGPISYNAKGTPSQSIDPRELMEEIKQERMAGNVYDYAPQATRINPAGLPQSILPQHNIYNPMKAPLSGLDDYQT